MTVIDVHTHILSHAYVELLNAHAGPAYEVKVDRSGGPAVHRNGAPFMTLQSGMFDVDERIKAMDEAGVDTGILSLTCPNVYWGTREASGKAARVMNDHITEAGRAHPGRLYGLASLPWQYPDDALAELTRACDEGRHVGVMVLANIADAPLTDERFAPIWAEIDRRGLPVLVHPTTPPGFDDMDMLRFNLIASIGFMIDTTLAITRIILDGFLDRYPNIKIIASHAGATLPYLAGRLDRCHEMMPAVREKISERPSAYLRRIFYDSVCYTQDALEMCVKVGGPSQVMYGSDYPHNIGDMEGCLARVDALGGDLAEDVRHRNAEHIFKLK
jgi:aminocarboxymuconate-semialdehyde decarboxylase